MAHRLALTPSNGNPIIRLMDDFAGMKRHLSRFEALAQRLVEGSFSRLFGGQLQALDLAAHLARGMEDNQLGGVAPDVYVIHLHPLAFTAVSTQNPHLTTDLAAYIEQLARQSSLSLVNMPRIEFVTDPNLPRHAISVSAQHGHIHAESTQVHNRRAAVDEISAAVQALDAFLILDGRRHVALQQPIVTLGRRMDNDVVLESAAVSRKHAQIRWRYGRFVLYDLSGRGRTAVNGETITECVLQPGDVIALSDTLIIYGEGSEDKPPRPSSSSDGSTGTLLLPPQEDSE